MGSEAGTLAGHGEEEVGLWWFLWKIGQVVSFLSTCVFEESSSTWKSAVFVGGWEEEFLEDKSCVQGHLGEGWLGEG